MYAHSDEFKQEVLEPNIDEIDEILQAVSPAIWEIWPEINYFSFSFTEAALVLPEVFKAGKQFILPDLGSGANISWNAMDAVASIGLGVMQLISVKKGQEHRKYVTGIKGGANIGVGVQLAVLTGVGATTSGSAGLVAASALGPIGFAAAFTAGFVLSLDDAARATRQYLSFNYWLEDILAEMAVKEKMILELEQEIEELHIIPDSKLSRIQIWAIQQKEDRLAELKNEVHEIHLDIQARLAVRNIEDPKIKVILDAAKHTNPDSTVWQKLNEIDQVTINVYRNRETNIRSRLKFNIADKYINSLIWGTAAAGMLLLCVPGGQALGAILVTIAAGLYFIKNSKRFKNKLSNYLDERTLLKPLRNQYEQMKMYAKQLEELLNGGEKDEKRPEKIKNIQSDVNNIESVNFDFKTLSPTTINKIKRMNKTIEEVRRKINQAAMTFDRESTLTPKSQHGVSNSQDAVQSPYSSDTDLDSPKSRLT